MSYKFIESDIEKIAITLGLQTPKLDRNTFRYKISDQISGRKVTLEIYPELEIGNRKGNLITAYTPVGMMQLHFCTDFIASDELGEVIFFAEAQDKLTGFIVSKDAGLTCYSNVDKDILSKDPLKLSGEILGCVIQLGLTEHKLQEIK